MASKRSSGAMTTRRRSMSHVGKKMGKHRGAWVAGLAAAGVLGVAGILLFSRKANAATPPAGPPAGPTTSYTALQAAALNANTAQAQAGYTAANIPYYQALQTAAGLTADGWPGQNTYNAVINALASINPPVAPTGWIATYTFANPPGFTGGPTAPTVDQWFGSGYTGSTDVSGAATVPAGTNATVINNPVSGS